jgi:FixJ family two-component response regulator
MSYRVLIVDDDREVIDTMRDILEAEGFQTLGATTFDDGRRLLDTEPRPHVLIADVRLGRYNGLQLVLSRHASTAAIVISGHWDRTIEDEARRLGAIFLLKPVPSARLVEMVRQAAESEGNPQAT